MKKQIADPMGLSVEAAAQGVISVVNSNMARAIRVITVEKGHNPSDFTCGLRRRLSPRRPPGPGDGHPHGLIHRPGALCALGLLTADIKELCETALIPYDQATPEQINQAVLPLMEEGGRWLASETSRSSGRPFHNVAEMCTWDRTTSSRWKFPPVWWIRRTWTE